MARTFGYGRVSTDDQTTDNQLLEIKAAGFNIEPMRMVVEKISGSVAANERPVFAKLLDRLEAGDVLVVTKLDRLGRNAIDIRQTVERLATAGIRVHCLQLGGMDLTSSTGKMIMMVIGAMAEFERDLIRERTQAGLERARAAGVAFGRPVLLDTAQRDAVCAALSAGTTISEIARNHGVSRQTIMRVRDDGGATRQPELLAAD